MKTPSYQKWYDMRALCVPRQSTRTTTPTEPTYHPGQILAQAEGDKSKGPPSNGESENISGDFEIPYAQNEDGTEESILATCKLTISVEDWGTGLIDGEQLIDCTASKEAPDNLGGHATWGGTASKTCASGTHSYGMTAQNITMDDPNQNKFVCKYNFEAVCLEAGGKKPKEPCGCEGNSCSPDGGAPPPPPGRARAAPPLPKFATSAAGSTVEALIDENGLLWSCSAANLRGLGAPLSGWLELTAERLTPALSTPSALAFRHPLAAELTVPEGGLVPGAKLELRLGSRVIAFRCYEDGSIRPIGVDTAGLGRASLSTGETPRFRWQNANGEAWEFSGVTGELLSYADKNGITVQNASDYLQIVRDGDGALRQIWSYWDGLLNIENVVLGGYTIALYTANQLAGRDASTGLYTLKEGATPFKRFVISFSATTFTITEQTPEREDFVRTWAQSTNGGWSLTTGVGEEAVTQTQERSELEAGVANGMLGVWQLVTSYAKGGIMAARTCEIYQTTPVGNLCLTRVEGYGSDAEQTTSFEYDGSGNLIAETSPTGQKKNFVYDETGRVIRASEPWRSGEYNLLEETAYAHSTEADYDADPSSVTVKLSPSSGEGSSTVLRKDTYTYSEAEGVKRVEKRTTALGSQHTQLSILETWLDTGSNPYAQGRTRMEQGIDGVQTWYDYAATSAHGALYCQSAETRVNGQTVAGQSTRQVRFITSEGTAVREESWLMDSEGTWRMTASADYEFDVQNRWIRRTRGHGRTTTRALMCTGEALWEIDEDGVKTDYAYDSARQLVEIIRSEVSHGDAVVTPETITSSTRDAVGRITLERTDTGAMTATTSTSYDLAGRVTMQTDVLGRTTATTYSSDGLTTTVTTPAGATLVTERHPDGSLAREHGTGRRDVRHTYDLGGGGTRQTTRLGETTTILSQEIRDGFGATITRTTPTTNGYVYDRSVYDARGLLNRRQRDTGSGSGAVRMAPTLMEYDDFGNLTQETLQLADEPNPENSDITAYAYAVENRAEGVYRVITTTRCNGNGGTYTESTAELASEHASLEQKTVLTDPRGNVTTHKTEYGVGPVRVQKTTLPTSTMTAEETIVDGFTAAQSDETGVTVSRTRTYTETGQLLTETDGRGNTTTTTTDLAGRTVSVTDAAGNETATTYDSHFDAPARVTDALGHTACSRYDLRGRKTAEWGTGILPALFAYDEADRLTSLTTFRAVEGDIASDPTGRTDGDTTTWAYHDATGLVTQKTYADGSTVTQTWDAFNRPATVTNARGLTTTCAYETARGLLTGVSFSDSTPARSYGWDSVGKLASVTDASGTRTLSCNDYGEALGDSLEADGKTHTIEEQKDAFGRSGGYVYTKDNAVQQTTGITYDETGRIATASFLHGGEAKTFAYGYLEGTRLLQTLTHPNNITITTAYEAVRDLPISMNATRGTTDVVLRGYTYDALARPSARSLARQAATRQDAFAYNTRSELTGAELGTDSYGYAYDNIGNRKTADEAAASRAYTANKLNQYMSITKDEEAPFVPSFDADGNQTRIKTSTGIWTASYDAENRPVRFEKEDESEEGPTVIECGYDYLGRRYMKRVTQNGVVTKHERSIYRGYLQIAALDMRRAAHPALWYVLWDPTEPVATRPLAIQKDGTWYTYGHDLTKNVWELYKANGTIATAYDYAPFGGVTANGSAEQPFQWSSEFYDAELGMVYYNFRFYNPLDGRWISRDPIGERDALNLLAFIGNHITKYIDYLGLATHGTKKCTKDEKCLVLAAKSFEWISHYATRYQELLADKYSLKSSDPTRYNSHVKKIEEAQQNAKNCLSYLAEKIAKNKCCKPGDSNPSAIPNFSPKPLPERISDSISHTRSGGSSWSGSDVATATAAVVAVGAAVVIVATAPVSVTATVTVALVAGFVSLFEW